MSSRIPCFHTQLSLAKDVIRGTKRNELAARVGCSRKTLWRIMNLEKMNASISPWLLKALIEEGMKLREETVQKAQAEVVLTGKLLVKGEVK